METIKEQKLLKKLVSPIHIEYISKYILECDIFETTEIIQSLINEGVIKESEYGKNYYVLKSKK